jgi:DNA-binding GntR family transcriptional regulator
MVELKTPKSGVHYALQRLTALDLVEMDENDGWRVKSGSNF